MRVLMSLLLTACGATLGDGDGIVDQRPQTGWQAPLTGTAHDVAGPAVLIDDDTLEIRDFGYDGGGLNARFFLVTDGAPFTRDIELTGNLVGSPSDGETLTIELPESASADWDAITFWCIPAAVSFGFGVFEPPLE